MLETLSERVPSTQAGQGHEGGKTEVEVPGSCYSRKVRWAVSLRSWGMEDRTRLQVWVLDRHGEVEVEPTERYEFIEQSRGPLWDPEERQHLWGGRSKPLSEDHV